MSGPTAEARDKELSMLADRVPILEVLQKREAAKALGDAATNPQASPGSCCRLSPFVTMVISTRRLAFVR